MTLPERSLAILRRPASWYLRRRWDIRQSGLDHVPQTGPAILAANHTGWLDGPLLIVMAPRPTHAWVKNEMFTGKTGKLLRLVGQIPVRRDENDAGALRLAAKALEDGQVVGVYPEGLRGAGDVAAIKPGVAWLALMSGAPVVPVAILGTRKAGDEAESRPLKGAVIDVVYGEPLRLDAQPWPRTQEKVRQAATLIHEHLRAHVEAAVRHTGQDLPGPLPKGTSNV